MPGERADLSIHLVDDKTPWSNQHVIYQSTNGVIEIKYANHRHPNFDFQNGALFKDINKLSKLEKHIFKYLMVIDEGNRIDRIWIRETILQARDKVTILSNNPQFYRLI